MDDLVTEFMLRTCRVERRPNIRDTFGSFVCGHMRNILRCSLDATAEAVPTLTGSVAELYIEPMLSCIGDVDVMYYFSDMLASVTSEVPVSMQLSADFHHKVNVVEIRPSAQPCYVYVRGICVLKRSADDISASYEIVEGDNGIEGRFMHNTVDFKNAMHGPAVTTDPISTHGQQLFYDRLLSNDTVRCLRCLQWPPQAAEWPHRRREYGWPDRETIDRVTGSGCDVVPVVHRRRRDDEWATLRQWRLSFSRAEIILIQSWTPRQQIVYHMLRYFVKVERLSEIRDADGERVICNYHVKTLMLWAAEIKPQSWWADSLVSICMQLLHTLGAWLAIGQCVQYFIVDCNLFHWEIQPPETECVVNRLASLTDRLLADWFVANYIRRCAERCPRQVQILFADTSTAYKLKTAVAAVMESRPAQLRRVLFEHYDSILLSSMHYFSIAPLSIKSYSYIESALARVDGRFTDCVAAATLLRVANHIRADDYNVELLRLVDVLWRCTCTDGETTDRGDCTGLQLVRFALTTMKKASAGLAATERNHVELSKAAMHMALKREDCKPYYCLVNVYLSALYCSTRNYLMAMYHCALAIASRDQQPLFSSHVVEGQLLPAVDEDIDNVLGLVVLFQYVRGSAVEQLRVLEQHLTVFTVQLFAYFLQSLCLLSTDERGSSLRDTAEEYQQLLTTSDEIFVTDLLLHHVFRQKMNATANEPGGSTPVLLSMKFLKPASGCVPICNRSDLYRLLVQSAVERLTTFRRNEKEEFGGCDGRFVLPKAVNAVLRQLFVHASRRVVELDVQTHPTTCSCGRQNAGNRAACGTDDNIVYVPVSEYEAMHAYILRNFDRCIQLCSDNLPFLLGASKLPLNPVLPITFVLTHDDFVFVRGLSLLLDAESIIDDFCRVTSLTTTLYLFVKSLLKRPIPLPMLTNVLKLIKAAHYKLPREYVFDGLMLSFVYRELLVPMRKAAAADCFAPRPSNKAQTPKRHRSNVSTSS